MAEMAGEMFSDEGPICPYCERQFTADEPGYYDESNYTSETCDACNKKFDVSVNHTTTWLCSPIETKPG